MAGVWLPRYLRRHAPWAASDTLLDFGCGPGFFLHHLSRLRGPIPKLYGLDFSAQSVADARARLDGVQRFDQAIAVSKLPAPWPAASFGYICAIEVIEHLDDAKLDGFFGEAHRLLRPHGVLFVTTPNAENLAANTVACPNCRHHFHRWQHVRSWTARSLTDHAAHYGFEPIRVEGTTFEPAWKRWARERLNRNARGSLAGLFRKA